jgi:hypothetical protein
MNPIKRINPIAMEILQAILFLVTDVICFNRTGKVRVVPSNLPCSGQKGLSRKSWGGYLAGGEDSEVAAAISFIRSATGRIAAH